jgi:hypothetical protein
MDMPVPGSRPPPTLRDPSRLKSHHQDTQRGPSLKCKQFSHELLWPPHPMSRSLPFKLALLATPRSTSLSILLMNWLRARTKDIARSPTISLVKWRNRIESGQQRKLNQFQGQMALSSEVHLGTYHMYVQGSTEKLAPCQCEPFTQLTYRS